MNKNKSTSRNVPGTAPDNRARGAERFELIRLGLDAGKSQRRIAAELGYDEGTIRRCVEIMQLPESWLTRVLEGAPAEKYIRAERRRAFQEAQQLQLAAEREAALKFRFRRLKNRKVEAGAAEAALSDNPDALYRWTLAMNSTARLTAEAKLLRQLAAALPKRS
jgi:hypothetical protein